MAFIRKFFVNLFLERPPKNKTQAQLIEELSKNKTTLIQKFSTCPRTPENHKVVTHIIGLERWGQNRLNVANGAVFKPEEYDIYRPSKDADWDNLVKQFESTRDTTLEIAKKIEPNKSGLHIRHNQWGDISVKAWLHYLNFHSTTEAKRIKG
jgi:hypothetical protein